MKSLPTDVQTTLDELRSTLDGMSPDSELYDDLGRSIRQLNRTLGNLEVMTRTLSNQPNAVIFPADLPPDPQPEAKP